MKSYWRGLVAAGLAVTVGAGCVGCSQSESPNNEAAADNATTEQETQEAQDVSIEEKYVTADWLKIHLNEVTVVDARSADTFAASHIPGAANLHWTDISNVAVDQGESDWGELADSATIYATATVRGIDGSKPIVIYTNTHDGWGEDGRIYWSLREAGFDDVHILDGGWSQWIAVDGDMVETKLPDEDADPIEQVDIAYVKEHMNSAVLVDARTEAEYNGETVMGESRMGRIPGAINIPYVSLIGKDGTLLPDDELKAVFDAAGVNATDEVIVYCTGGVRAAAVAEIMADRGYENVKVYTAGFSEWAGDSKNEIEAEAPVPAE